MTGETVLVVEDEGLIALHLTELLEKSGFRVTGPAYSGEMVLREIGKTPLPDLILMDIALAGKLDGIETARQIRQQFPALPLIFVTAYSPERTMERMREMAPDGVIVKPFLDSDLLAMIAKALVRQTA
jgi:CheY-like chemotaxis protein